MLELNDKLLKIPTETCCGVLCWTPKDAAKAIGMHKNTINGWIRKTKKGLLDMPFYSAPTKKSRSFIPIKQFLEWYNYVVQNQ